jgi:hypothetical protein
MDTSETGDSEPPSDGVARAQRQHTSRMVGLSRDRARVHQKDEDKVLPDGGGAFHHIHVPQDVFRGAARKWQLPPSQAYPRARPETLHFPHRAPGGSTIQSPQLMTTVLCSLNRSIAARERLTRVLRTARFWFD